MKLSCCHPKNAVEDWHLPENTGDSRNQEHETFELAVRDAWIKAVDHADFPDPVAVDRDTANTGVDKNLVMVGADDGDDIPGGSGGWAFDLVSVFAVQPAVVPVA